MNMRTVCSCLAAVRFETFDAHAQGSSHCPLYVRGQGYCVLRAYKLLVRCDVGPK